MIAIVAALIGSLLGPGVYLLLTAIADRNPKGGDVKQAPSRSDESGGAEGNRTNSVGHLLHKRSD